MWFRLGAVPGSMAGQDAAEDPVVSPTPIRLRNLPVELYCAWHQHAEALLREATFVALERDDGQTMADYPLAGQALGALAEAAQEKTGAEPSKLDAYIAWRGAAALAPATRLARQLRRDGLRVEMGYEPAKLKKSLGLASRLGARFAVIIGEGELSTGRYQVKNMGTGVQEEVDREKIVDYLKASAAKQE